MSICGGLPRFDPLLHRFAYHYQGNNHVKIAFINIAYSSRYQPSGTAGRSIDLGG